jgi:hypothetical protein
MKPERSAKDFSHEKAQKAQKLRKKDLAYKRGSEGRF